MTAAVAPLVYVVDDDEAMRDSLRWLLESAGYAVATFATAEHFLARRQPGSGMCLLLDVRMPGMSGIALQEHLLEQGEFLPIIFLTGHGDVPMAVGAVRRGAVDFIEKPFKDRDLLPLIDSAIRVDRQSIAAKAKRARALARLATLSPREREVMELVVAGKLNKVIADELGISIKTVEVHRSRVMQKLGAESIADLVQMTLGAGR
jgi:FixJ family two-component response regulator